MTEHIFEDYNMLKLAIPTTYEADMLPVIFDILTTGAEAKTPFEFMIGDKIIEYPDHLAHVNGHDIKAIRADGIDVSLKAIYSYDIETFPNFFSVVFQNINNPTDIQTYIVYDKTDDRLALAEFVNNPLILVGFNSESFDDVILKMAIAEKYIKKSVKDFTWAMYAMGQRIVKDDLNKEYWHILRLKKRWFTIDLMTIMALDQKGVSLKRCAIIMGLPKIQDLPFAHNKQIEAHEAETLIKYNDNDVKITTAGYFYIQSEIETRLHVGKLFNLSLMTASRSKMGDLLTTDLYQTKTGRVVKNGFQESRVVKQINLKDCIGRNIYFETDELKGLLDRIAAKVVEFPQYKFSESIIYPKLSPSLFMNKADIEKVRQLLAANKKIPAELLSKVDASGSKIYDIGVGGLHSRDSGHVFEATEDMLIIDCDVSSFYPFIILNNELYPKHLGPEFTKVYRGIVEERIRAKHEGEKVLADALKISINAVFGRLGSQYSWLYDMQVFLSVTLSGQLYLLSLIEKLVSNKFQVISANTDGIVSLVPKDRLEEYEDICSKWSDFTDFELEYTYYQKLVQRDVNNYLTLKPDGSFKTKGVFTPPGGLDLGYKPAITSKALRAYFIDGIAPMDTIEGSTNICDFLIAQKAGKNFNLVYEYVKDTKVHWEETQKTNRYFVSNSGGSLVKVDKDNPTRKISMLAGESVALLNDVDDYDPKAHDIKYQYYLNEINKVIKAIEGVGANTAQTSLFDDSMFIDL